MQVFPVSYRPGFDDDYDNAVENSPMIYSQFQDKSQPETQWRTGSFPSRAEELPEPHPLTYPSARRPMTFDQVSSSKMSIYDNVQFGLDKLEEEWSKNWLNSLISITFISTYVFIHNHSHRMKSWSV